MRKSLKALGATLLVTLALAVPAHAQSSSSILGAESTTDSSTNSGLPAWLIVLGILFVLFLVAMLVLFLLRRSNDR